MNTTTTSAAKFTTGKLHLTGEAKNLTEKEIQNFLQMHTEGMSDINQYQAEVNRQAIAANKGNVISAYECCFGEQIKVYTDLEAQQTTIIIVDIDGKIIY